MITETSSSILGAQSPTPTAASTVPLATAGAFALCVSECTPCSLSGVSLSVVI